MSARVSTYLRTNNTETNAAVAFGESNFNYIGEVLRGLEWATSIKGSLQYQKETLTAVSHIKIQRYFPRIRKSKQSHKVIFAVKSSADKSLNYLAEKRQVICKSVKRP